jgi:uncharacterized Zn-finger protein
VFVHLNKRQFVCDWNGCKKGFNKKAILKQHKLTVHLNERKFKCNYNKCEKKFFSKTELNNHKCIHSGEKTFICEHKNCDQKFTQRAASVAGTTAAQIFKFFI